MFRFTSRDVLWLMVAGLIPPLETNAQDEKRCTLTGPAVAHIFAIKLHTIENIEQLQDLKNVVVSTSPLPPPKISADNLPGVIASAKPLAADADIVDRWHYASPTNATFECQNRKWSVSLFPGGLGLLKDEEGRTGAFMFKTVVTPNP